MSRLFYFIADACTARKRNAMRESSSALNNCSANALIPGTPGWAKEAAPVPRIPKSRGA